MLRLAQRLQNLANFQPLINHLEKVLPLNSKQMCQVKKDRLEIDLKFSRIDSAVNAFNYLVGGRRLSLTT